MDISKDKEQVKEAAVAASRNARFPSEVCATRAAAGALAKAGVRLTSEGLDLARLVFQDGDKHFTAASLFDEAAEQNSQLPLSVIDRTLEQFANAGLLRRLSVDGHKTWYDTNTSAHHHFYCEEDDSIVDIEDGEVLIAQMPAIPNGMEVAGVEVVVRLKQRAR